MFHFHIVFIWKAYHAVQVCFRKANIYLICSDTRIKWVSVAGAVNFTYICENQHRRNGTAPASFSIKARFNWFSIEKHKYLLKQSCAQIGLSARAERESCRNLWDHYHFHCREKWMLLERRLKAESSKRLSVKGVVLCNYLLCASLCRQISTQ